MQAGTREPIMTTKQVSTEQALRDALREWDKTENHQCYLRRRIASLKDSLKQVRVPILR